MSIDKDQLIKKIKFYFSFYSKNLNIILLFIIIISIYYNEGFDFNILRKSFVIGAGADISIPKDIYELRLYLNANSEIKEIHLCDAIQNNEPLKQQIYENIYPAKIIQDSKIIVCSNEYSSMNKKLQLCSLQRKLNEISIYACY